MPQASSLINRWLPVWLTFAAFFENMAQQPLIAVFSVNLGASAALAGITVGIYSLFNIAGNLLAGPALARWGARAVLGQGMLAVGLTVMSVGLSRSPLQLLALRAGHGVLGGLLVPAIFVHLAGFSPRRRYGSSMARGGMAIALAATAGPILAGFINQRWGYTAAFATVGSVLVISGTLALALLPRQRPEVTTRSRATWSYLREAWLSLQVQHACLVAFAFMAGMGIMAFRFPLRGQELGLLSGQIGLGFGVFSLAAAATMWPAGQLSDDWGRTPWLVGGLALCSLGMLGLSRGQTYPSLLLALAIHGIGFGTLFPVANALLLDGVPSPRRGMAFGLFHGFFSLGVFLGPLLAVALLAYLSPFHLSSAIHLLVAAATVQRRSVLRC